VFADVVPQEHELVHAVHAPDGLAHDALEEGIAEFWGDDASWRPPLAGSVSGLLDKSGTTLGLADYALAGHFVSYLISAEGIDAFESMMTQTEYDTTYDALGEIFASAYGKTVAEVITEYEASYALCDHAVYRRPGAECELPVAVTLDCATPPTEVLMDVACEGESIIGPRDDEIWTSVVVDVAESGSYYVYSLGAPASEADWLRFKSCCDCRGAAGR
jgi:hypothetical protein